MPTSVNNDQPAATKILLSRINFSSFLSKSVVISSPCVVMKVEPSLTFLATALEYWIMNIALYIHKMQVKYWHAADVNTYNRTYSMLV